MYSRILGLTTSALILAYGTTGAFAQNQTIAPEPDKQLTQPHSMAQGAGTMGHEGMMGGGMMGRGMDGGMMGPPFMMRMMFALMDTDSDGTVSLEEFQAAHERLFKAMDSNKDGKLTLEEMLAFMHGSR